MKKIIALVLVLALSFGLASCQVIDKVKGLIHEWRTGEDAEMVERYERGLELIESGNLEEAYAIFKELGDFRDSKEIFARFRFVAIGLEASISGYDGSELITYDIVASSELNEDGFPVKITLALTMNNEEMAKVEMEYSYDSEGRLIKMIETEDGESDSTEYFYDDRDNVIQEIYTDTDGRRTITNYTYDSENRLTETKYVPSSGDSYTTYFQYDAQGNEISKHQEYSDGSAQFYNYAYDENGNKIEEKYYSTSSNGYTSDTIVNEWHYDANGNLVKEIQGKNSYSTTTIDYTYDANANLLKKVRTYKSGDSYTSVTSEDYYYDANNNMIKKVTTDVSGESDTYEYTYDANGNMIKEVFTEASGTVNTANYAYDSYGNKITITADMYGATYKFNTAYRLVYLPDGMTEDMFEDINVLLDIF